MGWIVVVKKVMLLGVVLLGLSARVSAATWWEGLVVRVVDGDTLVLLRPGNVQERMRLSGIDTPERRQAFGTKEKEALLARVGGQGVAVEWDKRDRYGRAVGKIVDRGGDVNLSLVRAGICWWYRKYADEQSEVGRVSYEAAESSARRGVGRCNYVGRGG